MSGLQAPGLRERSGKLKPNSFFSKLPPGKTAVVGVGNPSRGDDGCGDLVARKLKKKNIPGAFPCGQTPENYLGKIRAFGPEFVLIVDAVDFGAGPGEIKFFTAEEVFRGLSTHTAGLDLTAKFLQQTSGAKVAVLGIQPRRLDGDMTPPVKAAVEETVRHLKGKLCTSR